MGTRKEWEPPFLKAWVADVAPLPRPGFPGRRASLGSLFSDLRTALLFTAITASSRKVPSPS